MNDLDSMVRQAQADLAAVYSAVKKVPPGVPNPVWLSIQRVWIGKAKLHEYLGETAKLFECRDAAMTCLEDLHKNMSQLGSKSISATISFGATVMPIFAARLLALDSYLASTWSIYDRLSNILGRLMGNDKIAEESNPAQNPKLVDDLIGQAKGCYQGFGINELLPKLYGELIYSSYFLRNSFMHDGGMMDNVSILSGSIAATCFVLSKENAEKINHIVSQRLGSSSSGFFSEGDLIEQLKKCHNDLDKMFVSLMRFIVGSFCMQVSMFCGRIGITPAESVELG